MPGKGRWVICPMVEIVGPDGTVYREPKVMRKLDPGNVIIDPDTGLPITQSVSMSCAPHPTLNDWCVAFVRAIDFSEVDADTEISSILERDHDDAENFLSETPNTEGWSRGKLNRLERILSDRGVDTTGLTANTPFWQWIERLGQARLPEFSPRGTWAR